MRLRRILAGAVGGLVAVEAANRVLAARSDPLPPALAGDQGTYRWRGFDVAYTEAGDPEDPDVVCLHGVHAAASTAEFDAILDALAADHHVLAPDLPGFGCSDRPPVAYTSTLYESFLADFLADTADDPVVLGSSLAGGWAAAALGADGVDASRLVLVCPTADTGPLRPWVRRLFRSPVLGTGLFNALVSKPSLRAFDERDAFYRAANVPDELLDHQWRTAHQPNARFAPASFVSGYLDPTVNLGRELAAADCPVTLVWGREATITPLADGRVLADEADARLVVVDDTRLLPHAEQPDAFLEAVRKDLPRLEAE
ncbi:alpha/beta fold hydrolase [Halobacterium zhouii]|uniref:alpha/beta fold hydrolase n=1 Tax=Halobacterium zhouii TaxID=2902624 RepID=UPI001E59D213|nr:alpha/beta fold hydrolase [Halobacterium zhouii]